MINNEQLQILQELTGINITKLMTQRLNDFVRLFLIYNSHTNLVSKNDEQNLFEKHIYDSLALSLFFQKYNIQKDSKLLDIGTGGGFPSLPLAIFYPEMNIYPLDSIAKKIGFVELVQKELRLDNLYPICARAEDFAQNNKEVFDVVTSRAVASLNMLLEYTIPFVKTGSYFVAFKSKNADTEIEKAQNAFEILNCEIVDRIQYALPIEEDFKRELIVIKKNKNTPALYPRKSGLVKKMPL